MAREKSAANHKDHAAFVWFLRLKYVQSQRRPELTPVDGVFRAREFRQVLAIDE